MLETSFFIVLLLIHSYKPSLLVISFIEVMVVLISPYGHTTCLCQRKGWFMGYKLWTFVLSHYMYVFFLSITSVFCLPLTIVNLPLLMLGFPIVNCLPLPIEGCGNSDCIVSMTLSWGSGSPWSQGVPGTTGMESKTTDLKKLSGSLRRVKCSSLLLFQPRSFLLDMIPRGRVLPSTVKWGWRI